MSAQDRRERGAAKLEQRVAEVVAAAPPLTERQLARLSTLLGPTAVPTKDGAA